MKKMLMRCCIRCVKVLAIIIPFTVIFLLLLVAQLNENGSSHPHHPRAPRTKTKRLPPPEPLEVMLERTSACQNKTLLTLNAKNASVINFCTKFNSEHDEYFRLREEKVNPYIHNFTISGSRICDDDTDIIMLIHSLHNYTDRRKAIRETWGGAAQSGAWPGRTLTLKIKVAYIFGTHADPRLNKLLLAESEQYQDIIQGTFRENYNNMTLKSLLGLKFVKEYCPNAKYLLKSDDDMVINFPYLENILTVELKNNTRYIMGPLCVGSKVYRKGKWGLPKEKYPFYFYPPYEAGSAYIITADLISDLFHTAEYIPQIHIDDVYITGILGKILNVTHIRHKGFAFWTNKKPKVDDLINDEIVTGTKMKPDFQVKLWKELINLKGHW